MPVGVSCPHITVCSVSSPAHKERKAQLLHIILWSGNCYLKRMHAGSSAKSLHAQPQRRRQRAEFFELHRKIALDLWTKEQHDLFLKMYNEKDDSGTDDEDVRKEDLTFEMIFDVNELNHAMILPQYLGRLKVFDIIPISTPISTSTVPPGATKKTPGMNAGLINGAAMDLMYQGESLLMRRMYDAALSKYFDAIRLVPYKKACFYTSCAVCYSHLGNNELVMINSRMAATIDPNCLEAWILLASSAIRVIDTKGLMNINHRVGPAEKEIAAHFAQVAYHAIIPIYDKLILKQKNGASDKGGEIHDIDTLKKLLDNLEEKNMVGALDDMHQLLK